MERHRCQLCSRKFSNGRALGGHMRSHMMTLRIPPKQALAPLPPARSLSFQNEYVSESETLSSPSSPFSTSEEILVDEVVFEPTLPSSLISLRDRESETECFKKSKTNNPTRNRRFSSTSSDHPHHHCRTNDNDEADPPGRSSISDVTSDEDLAFFLMMLSRDKWSGTSSSTRTTVIRKFRCHTCNKSFKSYQALGGHRASHKKIQLDHEKEEDLVAKKVHECPFCFRVFSSGQALGGHKRSHFLLDAAHGGSTGISSSLKKVISDVHESIIDLNLPAPAADEDDSAVSDVHLISDQF